MEIGLDPNNSVIKRLWCMYTIRSGTWPIRTLDNLDLDSSDLMLFSSKSQMFFGLNKWISGLN